MAGPTGLLMLAFAGFVLIVGLLLVAFGMFGRRQDVAPYCARCGFDLTGRDPDAERCPECGTILNLRAIRTTRRAKRRMPLFMGIFLLVIGLGLLGLTAAQRAGSFNINHWKPVSWLRSEAAGSGQTALMAQLELNRRRSRGDLRAETIRDIVDDWLIVQGDPNAIWTTQRGNFFELAHLAGQITPEQLQQYLRQFQLLSASCRSSIVEGQPLPVEIVSQQRSGNVHYQKEAVWPFYRRMAWGPITPFEDSDPAGRYPTSRRWIMQPAGMTTHRALDLPPGKHRGHWQISLAVTPNQITPEPIVEWTVSLPLEFEVLPAGTTDDVRLVPDASIAAAVRDAMSVTVNRRHQGVWLTFAVSNMPTDAAFEVFIIDEDGEHAAGLVAPRESFDVTRTDQYTVITDIEPTGETIDIELRPSRAAARMTLDMVEAWDGMVRLEDVPVPPKRSE